MEMYEFRRQLGYPDFSDRPYLMNAYKSEDMRLKSLQLAYDADVVIIGSAPEEYVTREQLAVILYRYAKEPDADTFLTIDKFDDANIVSEWAIDAVKWAYGSKILNGTSEAKISPYETATRAQVATMVMRYANTLKEN